MSRFSLIFILLLSGCQLAPPAQQGWAPLGQGYYQLLDHWPGPERQLLQQAQWQNERITQQFLLSALLKHDTMLLVALSPLGQELWRLEYQRGHQLQVSGMAPFNQPEFARQLLAQMQLALLDETVLKQRLQGLRLQQSSTARTLYDKDGKLLLTVTNAGQLQAGNEIQIDADSYRLRITTLQQDFLP